MKRAKVQGRKTSPGKKGSNSRSPNADKNKGGKSQKASASPSRKYQGGYLDAIADQEAKLISMTSLQEGEEFEKDINNIISIIDGVEKSMSH